MTRLRKSLIWFLSSELITPYSILTISGDKGYVSADPAGELMNTIGIRLLPLRRKNDNQQYEWGFITRIRSKFSAHSLCYFINAVIGKLKRSLIKELIFG